MKKRTSAAKHDATQPGNSPTVKQRSNKISRESIHSLRGKYRGKGLMKALMAEKKREREL